MDERWKEGVGMSSGWALEGMWYGISLEISVWRSLKASVESNRKTVR